MKFSMLIVTACFCLLPMVMGESAIDKILSAASEDDSSGGCNQKADIFFAVDSSHSVGAKNFEQVKTFLQTIVSSLLKRSNQFRFGFVIFSDKADMVVKLKDFDVSDPKKAKDLLKFIMTDITYVSGKTVTGEAFQLIRYEGFKPNNGHRKGVKKMIVLLTDGKANGHEDPFKEAKKLHNSGVNIVPLGIGTGIKKATLERLSSKKKYVTMVESFKDLGRVSNVITKIVCKGDSSSGKINTKSSPYSRKAKKVARAICGRGYLMIGGTCIRKKPTCKKRCPTGYKIMFPCRCKVQLNTDTTCRRRCAKGKVLAKGCKCVPRKFSFKKPKRCTKRVRCGKRQRLSKHRCKCVCKKRCGKQFEQLRNCKCKCSLRCVEGFAVDKFRCKCKKIKCPSGYIFYRTKCKPDIKKYCTRGHVLFKDVCTRSRHCPKGYKRQYDRSCKKVGCDPGYKMVKNKCKKMCTGKQYYWKGRCHSPKKCPLHQFFDVRAEGCPRTCNEPVLITECKRSREPQCKCTYYYLLHKGKCVHPSDCPNIPICIQMADVIFMLDSSLTVTEKNFYMMKNFVRDVVQQFYLKNGKRQRVGILKFHHKSEIILDLDSWKHYSHEKILKVIENIEYEPGLTFTGEALHKVRTIMWNPLAGMREDVPHVTILLTDGTKTNGEIDPYYEAKKLRESGSFFVTIAIGDDAKRTLPEMRKMAGPEGRVFLFGLREFQDIHGLVARVLAFHCDRPQCPRPINFEGPCVGNYKAITRIEYIRDGFRCKKVIHEKYRKVRCSCPHASQSNGPCRKMFRTITTTRYLLNDKKKSKVVCDSKEFKSKQRCSCPPAKTIVGKCENEFRTTTIKSFKLQRGGTMGFTCEKVKESKRTRCSCSQPKRKYTKCKNNFRIMRETSFEFVHETKTCLSRRRTKELRCSCPKPSLVTAHCNGKFVPVKIYEQVVNKKNKCDQRIWTNQEKCKKTCAKKLDLAFVVDSSDSVRGTNFEYVRRFINAVVAKYHIGHDETHVALLKYSSKENLKVIFNYIAHYNVNSMKERINVMQYSPGSTYTGDAIKNFRTFLMNKINGWRGNQHGFESVLILITDGSSNSEIDPIKEASKVKALGSKIITVGVGDDIQDKEIDAIATEPAEIHSFKTSAFSDLVNPTFVHEVVMATCKIGKVNKVSVFSKYSNLLNDALAKTGTFDFVGNGFKRIKSTDLSHFEIKIQGTYISVVGGSQADRAAFLAGCRNSIAKELRVHPFSIEKLHISRKMLLSGLLLTTKINTLKTFVTTSKLRLKKGETVVKYDPASFIQKSYESLEVLRQASESADVILNVMRPLRRLVRAAKRAAPLIVRKTVKAAANRELKKMSKLAAVADAATDKLIVMSNLARKTRKEKLARQCIAQFRKIMGAAAKVVRRVSYVSYFCKKGDRNAMKELMNKVLDRLSNAYGELGLAEEKILEKKKALLLSKETKAGKTKLVSKSKTAEKIEKTKML